MTRAELYRLHEVRAAAEECDVDGGKYHESDLAPVGPSSSNRHVRVVRWPLSNVSNGRL